jgi:TonB family protein
LNPRVLAARPFALLALVVVTGAPVRAFAQEGGRASSAHVLTKPPRLIAFVEAPYPEAERPDAKPVTVVLELSIDAAGTVQSVKVSASGGAAFDAAAAAAARQFRFEPAEVDGKASPIRILYKYEFVVRTVAPTTAVFAGLIRHARTKAPLAGVRVSLDGRALATTDAEGRFRVKDVAPGGHAIGLTGEHLVEVQTTETFEAGKETDVTYEVTPEDPNKSGEDKDDLEIVVAAPALQKEVVSTAVAADEGRKVPGAQGDVLKVVEDLPGVARAAVGSAQLVVWGSAPQDTQVFVDGVPIPTLYHQGGFRSVVGSEMVQSVALSPGGWGAEYGRGVGGLVDVKLKPLDESGFHGAASADVLDAAADARARIADGVYAEVAGRKSYLDALLPAFTSRNVGEYVPIPRYWDSQARLVWRRSPGETLEVGGLVSGDSVTDEVPSSDPTNVQTQRHDSSFWRAFVRWKKTTGEGAEITVVPSIGANRDALTDQFGVVPTDLSVDSLVATVRASYRKALARWATVSAGVDAQLTRSHFTRTGSNTSPPRPGDEYVFGQAPTDQVSHDDGTTIAASAAPYGWVDIAPWGEKVHVVPGIRIDPYLLSSSRAEPPVGNSPPIGVFQERAPLEPRLSLRVSPVRWLTWKAAWGLYHEPPAPADLSSVFGNPTLGLETARHLLGGAEVGTPDIVAFELTAFRVTSDGLAVRSPLPSPLVAQALVGTGLGRTRGLQVLLRKTIGKKAFAWVTYTLSKAERATSSASPYYPYDYDQTHVLTALASYELPWGLTVGSRFRYATGYPRTPVVGAYFDTQTGAYEPLFGALNSIRIPSFVQLDARVARTFSIGRAALEVYLDVQNVTNRANPEELVYSLDYSQRHTINGLPILPVLGARATW